MGEVRSHEAVHGGGLVDLSKGSVRGFVFFFTEGCCFVASMGGSRLLGAARTHLSAEPVDDELERAKFWIVASRVAKAKALVVFGQDPLPEAQEEHEVEERQRKIDGEEENAHCFEPRVIPARTQLDGLRRRRRRRVR